MESVFVLPVAVELSEKLNAHKNAPTLLTPPVDCIKFGTMLWGVDGFTCILSELKKSLEGFSALYNHTSSIAQLLLEVVTGGEAIARVDK